MTAEDKVVLDDPVENHHCSDEAVTAEADGDLDDPVEDHHCSDDVVTAEAKVAPLTESVRPRVPRLAGVCKE